MQYFSCIEKHKWQQDRLMIVTGETNQAGTNRQVFISTSFEKSCSLNISLAKTTLVDGDRSCKNQR